MVIVLCPSITAHWCYECCTFISLSSYLPSKHSHFGSYTFKHLFHAWKCSWKSFSKSSNTVVMLLCLLSDWKWKPFWEVFNFGNVRIVPWGQIRWIWGLFLSWNFLWSEIALLKVMCGKTHFHDVKSTYPVKIFSLLHECAAMNILELAGWCLVDWLMCNNILFSNLFKTGNILNRKKWKIWNETSKTY